MTTSGSVLRLPDFIIIGAMKSATSTLQEQLAAQPGIFMSEPKEPNFFSDDVQYRRGVDWYAGLFAAAPPGDLIGEASTHYSKLPTHPESVKRMRILLPDVRLIYVMRHPVDRLVSHYIHEWSMGKIRCSIDEAVHRYPEMISYGEYAMQLKPFLAAYGSDAILPVFFDRLTHSPHAELERVCRFIGYRGKAEWISEIKPSNISSERLRRFPLYDLVIKSPLATRLRRALVPQVWRDRVKARMTMQRRPQLSPAVEAALEQQFDRDLERLGAWLGMPLNCKNFRKLTGADELDWSENIV